MKSVTANIILLWLIVAPKNVACLTARKSSEEGDLTRWLIDNCELHRAFRPAINFSDTLHATISLIILSFLKVEEAQTTVTLIGEILISYRHPFLTWGSDNETKQWENVTQLIRYGDNEIYQPPIWIPNSAGTMMLNDGAAISSSSLTTTINPDGTVLIDKIKSFELKCPINYWRFPFDQSECAVQLESTVPLERVTLKLLGRPGAQKGFHMINCDLELWRFSVKSAVSIPREYLITPVGNYSAVNFTFEMMRKPSFHVITTICPCMVLQALQLSAIFMPPKYPERAGYSMTVMLATSVLQTAVTQEIPRTSQTIVFVISLCIQIFIGMLCIIYALISCALARTKWFRKNVNLRPGSCCCRKPAAENEIPNVILKTPLLISRIRLLDIVFFGTLTFLVVVENFWAFLEMLNGRTIA